MHLHHQTWVHACFQVYTHVCILYVCSGALTDVPAFSNMFVSDCVYIYKWAQPQWGWNRASPFSANCASSWAVIFKLFYNGIAVRNQESSPQVRASEQHYSGREGRDHSVLLAIFAGQHPLCITQAASLVWRRSAGGHFELGSDPGHTSYLPFWHINCFATTVSGLTGTAEARFKKMFSQKLRDEFWGFRTCLVMFQTAWFICRC